jgi:hypothetical protein
MRNTLNYIYAQKNLSTKETETAKEAWLSFALKEKEWEKSNYFPKAQGSEEIDSLSSTACCLAITG